MNYAQNTIFNIGNMRNIIFYQRMRKTFPISHSKIRELRDLLIFNLMHGFL